MLLSRPYLSSSKTSPSKFAWRPMCPPIPLSSSTRGPSSQVLSHCLELQHQMTDYICSNQLHLQLFPTPKSLTRISATQFQEQNFSKILSKESHPQFLLSGLSSPSCSMLAHEDRSPRSYLFCLHSLCVSSPGQDLSVLPVCHKHFKTSSLSLFHL